MRGSGDEGAGAGEVGHEERHLGGGFDHVGDGFEGVGGWHCEGVGRVEGHGECVRGGMQKLGSMRFGEVVRW